MQPHTQHNVTSLLDDNADLRGDAPMFHFADGSVTWSQLRDDSARLGAALRARGIAAGDRVVVFIPMSPTLYTVLSAVQRIGAIPVVLESWVGRAHLEQGLASVEPKALVAPDMILAMCAQIPACAAIPMHIGVESTLPELLARSERERARAPIHPVRPDDTGLITFTTGSSGTPKGANRTHAFLRAQHEAIDAHLPYDVARDVDLPVFPIFCLNSAAAGVTTVLPAVDAGHPSDDDAARLAAQIDAFRVTTTTLNPGLLRALARYAVEQGRTFPTLRRVVVGGAPVGPADVALCRAMAPSATMVILYGSTEVEPICHITGEELAAAHGADEPADEPAGGAVDGVCAGRPTPGLAVKLLRPTRGRVSLEDEVGEVGEVGEIVVAGAHVCGGYWKNEDAFKRAKIRGRDGTIWHRTGDVGRFDEVGRLWIVGRVHTAVRRAGRVLFPVGVECALRALPFVRRAAYVGVPRAVPHASSDPVDERAIVAVELHDGERLDIERVLQTCAACHVPVDEVRVLDALPMDARHHSKVEVDELRAMLLAGVASTARAA